MAENKSSVSKAGSYQKIGEYWDAHDADEIWDETEEVKFEVDLESDVFYYAVETSLSSKLHTIAERRGVSAETLVNLWLQEKVNQEVTKN
ncbi:MAG: BrnA antitoxin family protein [Acidobacteriota bacterium]|nr:BrnA antitoxin family protein [Acidobacteriota bacterium]